MREQIIGGENADFKPRESGDEFLMAPGGEEGSSDSDHLVHWRCANIARSRRVTSAIFDRQSPFGSHEGASQ